MTNHSPLPWRVQTGVYYKDERVNVCDSHGNTLLGYINPDTARLIVLAVNHFEDMREALQAFVDRCEAGQIQSKQTHRQFKMLLHALKEADHDE